MALDPKSFVLGLVTGFVVLLLGPIAWIGAGLVILGFLAHLLYTTTRAPTAPPENVNCRSCGAPNEPSRSTCKHCGDPLSTV